MLNLVGWALLLTFLIILSILGIILYNKWGTKKNQEQINYDLKKKFQVNLDKMNKEEQEILEKEFLEYKNLGIVLFDIVSCEERDHLIESLKKLFNYDNLTLKQKNAYRLDFDNSLPQVEIDTTLHGHSIINIGTIQNLNLKNGYFSTPERELPSMYHNLRIKIVQYRDAYLIIIIGELKDAFKTKGIKESFVHQNDMLPNFKTSEDGQLLISATKSKVEYDPNMDSYFKELAGFVKKIGFGMYLNKDCNQICPNIKVTYLDEIPYNKFEDWSLKNYHTLKFMGFSSSSFSNINNDLWGIQSKRILNKLSISAGLVILASKNDKLIDKYESFESGILIDIGDFITMEGFAKILYQLYWANFNLEAPIKDWNKSLDSYVDQFNKNGSQKTSFKMKSLFKVNNEITNKYLDFEIYRMNEEKMYKSFSNVGYNTTTATLVKPLATKFLKKKFNIYDYLFYEGKELLELQKTKIEVLNKEFTTIFNYLNNVTTLTSSQINLSYQKKVKNYTIIVLVLTLIMVLLADIGDGKTVIQYLSHISNLSLT
ncbi:MAG: hypothetical protein AWU59_2544 [Methanolobus sp. T82-4]|nr:MAG: hypothetical protein AWU59_2544 [Methanolobus sp. T82-4]